MSYEKLIKKIPINSDWKHFKGNDYRVLGISKDHDNNIHVVYTPLYIPHDDFKLFNQPIQRFLEFIEYNNIRQPRFKRIH